MLWAGDTEVIRPRRRGVGVTKGLRGTVGPALSAEQITSTWPPGSSVATGGGAVAAPSWSPGGGWRPSGGGGVNCRLWNPCCFPRVYPVSLPAQGEDEPAGLASPGQGTAQLTVTSTWFRKARPLPVASLRLDEAGSTVPRETGPRVLLEARAGQGCSVSLHQTHGSATQDKRGRLQTSS